MRLLIIDTSSVVSLALIEAEGDAASVVVEHTGTDTHRHAEDLAPLVQRSLAGAGWERADAVLAGDGPGPFTGLRVGLATAELLGMAWDVPLYGRCSLDGLARELAPLARAAGYPRFLATLDARRREVYWAEYDAATAERVDGPHVGAPSSLPLLPVGGAGVAAAPALADGRAVLAGTDATVVSAAQLGRSWLEAGAPAVRAEARYLRESDAVVPGAPKPAGGAR